MHSQGLVPKLPRHAKGKTPPIAGGRLNRLSAIRKRTETPMIALSFVWLFILIAELVYFPNEQLHQAGSILWFIFTLNFLFRLAMVTPRWPFLKRNWLYLTAILVSVLRFIPVVQPFPIVRVITASFGMQAIWILASADQGMRSIRRKLGRRGVGYGLSFTAIVVFAGAAGMLHFEQLSEDPDKLKDYPRALWWTAMQMTNIGSAYSLRTEGGRVIGLAISVYAAAMFGYLTALFASFIIDREVKAPKVDIYYEKQITDLQIEITRLGNLIESRLPQSNGVPPSTVRSKPSNVQVPNSHAVG